MGVANTGREGRRERSLPLLSSTWQGTELQEAGAPEHCLVNFPGLSVLPGTLQSLPAQHLCCHLENELQTARTPGGCQGQGHHLENLNCTEVSWLEVMPPMGKIHSP